jgi:hypothetical protein
MAWFSYRRGLTGAAVASLLFAGCGQQVGRLSVTPSAEYPSSVASASRPEGTARKLLYVSLPSQNVVDVFKYPVGALVGELNGFDDPTGLCSDVHGNVWIANADNDRGNGTLVEYAHGGSSPIATLRDEKNAPNACSVDISTGNLAVADVPIGVKPNIAIYKNAIGSPIYYSTAGIVHDVRTIAYDPAGNLYLADLRGNFGLLRAGGSKVTKLRLQPAPRTSGALQWDGLELAVLTTFKQRYEIWRYVVRGTSARRGGIVSLKGAGRLEQFSIYGSSLAVGRNEGVWLFSYPSGGPSTYLIRQALGAEGVAFSE